LFELQLVAGLFLVIIIVSFELRKVKIAGILSYE
jgi:hypothetical protein